MGRFRFRPAAEASGLPRNLWITHTSGSAYRAATLLLLWIVALWRPALEATQTNLSIPELPVNCSAQLFLPASTLSIFVDLFMRESGSTARRWPAQAGDSCGAGFPAGANHLTIRPLQLLSSTRVETTTPKRNIKLKRSLSLAGGTRSESLCFPSVVRWPSSEGDFRITQPRGQGRLAFYFRCL